MSKLISRLTREHFVEKRPERENVAGTRDRFASGLFGGRAYWSETLLSNTGVIGRFFLFEQLRDPKVEKLRLPFFCHQDVFRLKVAVDNVTAMGHVYGSADFEKQFKAFPDGKRRVMQETSDRVARDILHDEIGEAIVAGPGVEQPSDIGMVQAG